MIRVFVLALAFATMAQAQDQGAAIVTSPIDGSTAVIPDVPANDVRALAGNGVELKGLDKVSGDVVDLSVAKGEMVEVGRLQVTLGDCRFPEDNQTGEAYAWLTILDPQREVVVFEGWMVASSPALNALDHPRYDIWVIRCTTA